MAYMVLQWHLLNLMKIQKKKPTVQVEAIYGKLLMDMFRIVKDNSIISIQDMGAAGLTFQVLKWLQVLLELS